MKIAMLLLLFLSLNAHSDGGLSIKAGTAVHLVSWKEECRCYEISVEENSAYGPLYVTQPELLKAIPDLPTAKVQRSPASIISIRYVLDKNLPMLTYPQYDARKAAISKLNRIK